MFIADFDKSESISVTSATAAEDAFATLSDASVFGAYAVDFQDGDMTSPSWIEHHQCRHDETPQQPLHRNRQGDE